MNSATLRTPPPGFAYRPDIDALRAVAVLAVIAYRALSARFCGVDVFFFWGHLITGIIGRIRRRSSTVTAWPPARFASIDSG